MYLCIITVKILKQHVDNCKYQSSKQIITTPPSVLWLDSTANDVSKWDSFL